MPFVANLPQPTDFLSNSQEDLRQNNLQLDASFGIDHYTFSNATADNGKHNQVTTPKIIGAAHPTTSATDMKFYCMQDTANIGLLQYSRGWDTAGAISGVPSAVSYVQSPNAPQVLADAVNSFISILDFTGITNYAIGKIVICNAQDAPRNYMMEKTFLWRGGVNIMTFQEVFDTFPNDVKLQMNGNVMRLNRTNTVSNSVFNVYWSIQFYRIVV